MTNTEILNKGLYEKQLTKWLFLSFIASVEAIIANSVWSCWCRFFFQLKKERAEMHAFSSGMLIPGDSVKIYNTAFSSCLMIDGDS